MKKVHLTLYFVYKSPCILLMNSLHFNIQYIHLLRDYLIKVWDFFSLNFYTSNFTYFTIFTYLFDYIITTMMYTT